jgi:TfoX/Sxy family transcriptional regulator of competence genes
VAYNEVLADRIRKAVTSRKGVTEKHMFGGVAFLLDGKMFVGVVKDDLMARVGPDRNDAALREAHVRPMDFTGKPMLGYVYVSPDGWRDEASIAKWVGWCADFVATLPAKKPAAKKPAAKKPAAKKKAR